MDWLTQLQGQTVGLDTSPLIYFIEQNPTYLEKIKPFFFALDRGDFKAVTSTVTLLEVLVHPFRKGETALAQKYRNILLNSNHLSILPVSSAIAERAAELRAIHDLRTPDAIQLATTLQERATAFLTNDSRLKTVAQLATSQNLHILMMDSI
jgi:predicted nucleic acid-binding protein